MSVGPCAEKFNIVSNDHGCTRDFSVSDRRYSFWENFVHNVKIVSLSWNWYTDWFEYAELSGNVHFFRFWPEMSFLGKFSPKNQNFNLSWILLSRLIPICRIQCGVHFFSFRPETTLFAQIWSKKSKLSV